ncbi:hypothetical protein [Paenibacillus catalpae]|uniref:hypothetical protein n=1 Tax=Paenibacillus catalpae TaxID=1045775 RepID=UPI0011138999|nr:hypothetical protein [Paenibacillus catalpae]
MNMPPLSPHRTVYLAVLPHIVALMESGLAEPCGGVIPHPAKLSVLAILPARDCLAGLQRGGVMDR